MKKSVDIENLVEKTFSNKNKLDIKMLLEEIDNLIEYGGYQYKTDYQNLPENTPDPLTSHFNGNSADTRNARNARTFEKTRGDELPQVAADKIAEIGDSSDSSNQSKLSLGDIEIINPTLLSKTDILSGNPDEVAFLRAVKTVGIPNKPTMREKFEAIKQLTTASASQEKSDIFKNFSSIYLLSSIIRTLRSMEPSSFGYIAEYLIKSFYDKGGGSTKWLDPHNKDTIADVIIDGNRHVSCKTLSARSAVKGSFSLLEKTIKDNGQVEVFLIKKIFSSKKVSRFDFKSRILDASNLEIIKQRYLKGDTFEISVTDFSSLKQNAKEQDSSLELNEDLIQNLMKQNSSSILSEVVEIHKKIKEFTTNFNNYIIPKENGQVDDSAGNAAVKASYSISRRTSNLVKKK